MAFRTFALRQGQSFDAAPDKPLHVVALQNGYHGDTLGTMDCAEESVFNAGQTPWYQPRGLFLEAPTCGIENGTWAVRNAPDCIPKRSDLVSCCTTVTDMMILCTESVYEYAVSLQSFGRICAASQVLSSYVNLDSCWQGMAGTRVQVRPPADACPATERQAFDSLESLFSAERDSSELASHYEQTVLEAMTQHESRSGAQLGACLMEPIMQGAGGMVFVDPLFQKVLLKVRIVFSWAQARLSWHVLCGEVRP